jgi:6-phosphogluconolactonase
MFLFGTIAWWERDRLCAIFDKIRVPARGRNHMGIARRAVIGGASAALAGAFVLSQLPASADDTDPTPDPSPEPSPDPDAGPARVYVGSYTESGGPGIGAGTADLTTGALTVATWTDRVPDPSWLDRAADGSALYAVSETSAGAVHTLGLSDPGTPVPSGSVPTGNGPAHLAVHPSGRWLFTSLYGGGAVAVHPIATDGTVGAATTTRRHTPDSGQSAAHAHQVVFDPTGRWALSVDLGTDSVYVEEFDPGTGTLGAPVRVRTAAGAGPRHLAFHTTGGYAYLANELDSTVTVCRWQDGVLTLGESLSTVPSTPPTRNYPSEIVVSADGRFVYLANRGANTVAVLAVGAEGATLDLVASPTCGGDWPRHLALAPGGAWLYVANQRSGDVSWLPVDPETGVPGPVAGSLPVTGAAHILFA